jgi:hypothetical protein
MNLTGWSLGVFAVSLALYLGIPAIGAPDLLVEHAQTPEALSRWRQTDHTRLGCFAVLVMLTQVIVGVTYVTTVCGSSLSSSMASVAQSVLVPWVLGFGGLVVALWMRPSLSRPFSNVAGYLCIATEAQRLWAQLWQTPAESAALAQEPDPARRALLSTAAEAVVKLGGQPSLWINPWTIDTFADQWTSFVPLLRPDLPAKAQQDWLNLIVRKERIGHAFWLTYTALWVSAWSGYQLSVMSCTPTVTQLNVQQTAYQANEAKLNTPSKVPAPTYTA